MLLMTRWVNAESGVRNESAVKDYQKKNNLSVDGIVGKNTWGSLTSGSGSSASTKTTKTKKTKKQSERPTYKKVML